MKSRLWFKPLSQLVLRACGLTMLLVLASAAFAGASPAGMATVEVRAALVGTDMQVRPVPLHPFVLVATTGDSIKGRTEVDGRAVFYAPAGRFLLASLAATTYAGSRYRWSVPVEVVSGTTVTVNLTNDNASVEAAESASVPTAGPDGTAASLFRDCMGSVFRIEAALTQGTGFLSDTLDGVILTNAHLVENADSTEIYAVLDPHTRVRAQVLALDSNADVAVLRVHPDHLVDRRRISLRRAGGAVLPGDRVYAMGYPLHQEITITAGIVSSARDGALMSDVSTSPGNSGGPLFAANGQAIALNTFRDARAGSGVAGAVLLERAGPALLRAADARMRTAPPSAEILPTMPAGRIDMEKLKASIANVDPKDCPQFEDLSVGNFNVTFATPALAMLRAQQIDNEITKDRKKREAMAGVPLEKRYSTLRVFRAWNAFVGELTTPVITVAVVPRVRPTTLFDHANRFAGDVSDVQLYRNDSLVTPLQGGHESIQMEGVKDVADVGYYAYDPMILRPDANGAPPRLVISIRDLKSQKTVKSLNLSATLLAAMWNGFESYHGGSGATEAFVPARAEAAHNQSHSR